MALHTWFLVDDGKAMPRWCELVRHGEREDLVWMDAKGRKWPKDSATALAVVDGTTIECTIEDVSPTIAKVEKDFALERLLDPWSNQGWISREGRFYGCAFYAHDDIALALLRRSAPTLEHEGYVRVHADSYRMSSASPLRMSPRQRDTLERLGFDVDDLRRGPYEADRTGPPPTFAYRAPPRSAEISRQPVDQPAETPEVTLVAMAPLLERLRASEALGFLFEKEEPELVTDLGGGNWSWLLYFSDQGFNLGTGEGVADLIDGAGIYLHATASDQVEMYPWHYEGVHVSADTTEVLANARYGYGVRP